MPIASHALYGESELLGFGVQSAKSGSRTRSLESARDVTPETILEMDANNIAACVIDRAVEIHRKIGPGLLDSVYVTSLAEVLTENGFTVERQESIPIQLRGRRFNRGPRAPLVVGGTVLVELKSLESLSRVHKKQMLTYLKLSHMRHGLLINFGDKLLKCNIERLENA